MVLEEKQFDNVNDFINALAIDGPTPGLGYSGYVFRGVSVGTGEDEMKLIPSSLRIKNFPELIKLSGSSQMDSEYEKKASTQEWIQARAESKILASFFRKADGQGLPMGEITPRMRQTMQTLGTSDALFNLVVQTNQIWPSDDLLPLAAQAQHYGLPTRLLDWSRDPWIAIYFSTKGALEHVDSGRHKDEYLAVWVLNAELLDFEKRLQRPKGVLDIPLTFVTAPASTNPNLRAQQGVFTVWRKKFTDGASQLVDRRPLEEQLEETFSKVDLKMPLLYKFTLPISLAPTLWKTIKHSNINAARLFPDFSGAAKAVMEESKWG